MQPFIIGTEEESVCRSTPQKVYATQQRGEKTFSPRCCVVFEADKPPAAGPAVGGIQYIYLLAVLAVGSTWGKMVPLRP